MIKFNMEKTGLRIKELRTVFGLSQKALAEKIGVAQNTLTQYEKGTSKISLDVIHKIFLIF